MTTSEFTISVEVEKPDLSCDDNGSFGILVIKIDDIDVTMRTTPKQDMALREVLREIYWSTCEN